MGDRFGGGNCPASNFAVQSDPPAGDCGRGARDSVGGRLIDCGFGVVGCVPLLVVRRHVLAMETEEEELS